MASILVSACLGAQIAWASEANMKALAEMKEFLKDDVQYAMILNEWCLPTQLQKPQGCLLRGDLPGWHAPLLCPLGRSYWNHSHLKAGLKPFAKDYENRPFRINSFGMNTNHAFALWFTVKMLQPLHIIESGVWCGQSTWLLRQAAPDAKIYSLDPLDKKGWPFRLGSVEYFLGENFQDFREVDWDARIPSTERSRTLLVLDDHQDALSRSQEAKARGILHIFYDDNFNSIYGYGDTYSFNMLCAPLPPGTQKVRRWQDMRPESPEISAEEHDRNRENLVELMEVYFEFPPIIDFCRPAEDSADWILRSRFHLKSLKLPSPEVDAYKYHHAYPAYVRLQR